MRQGATQAHIDLITAGWPCQDLSVAGKRAGLAGARSGLFWEVCRVADALRPEWLLLENVPGLLSANGGQDFWEVLNALDNLRFDVEWRVLDAQHFGVPQRRRRVFLVGHHRDWPDPGTVLLEPEGRAGDTPPVRRAGQDVAYSLDGRSGGCSAKENQETLIASTLRSFSAANSTPPGFAGENENLIAQPLTGEPYADAIGEEGKLVAHNVAGAAKHGRNPDVTDYVISMRGREGGNMPETSEVCPALRGAEGGSTRPMVLDSSSNPWYSQGNEEVSDNGDVPQARPREVLRSLRQTIGSEAMERWGLGVVAALREAKVLRPSLRGEGVGCEAVQGKNGDDGPLPRTQGEVQGVLRGLRFPEGPGRTPQGRELSQQLAEQLAAYLSRLSYPTSQGACLYALWEASQGLGLLRQALSEIQEVGGPSADQAQSAPAAYGVRRLTVLECERLMGLPDGFTDVGLSDTARYRLVGNAVAVPVIEWIGRRLPEGLTFGELFAGIGGFRLGLERAGHRCLWANELSADACKVRRVHWPDEVLYECDVRELCA